MLAANTIEGWWVLKIADMGYDPAKSGGHSEVKLVHTTR